MRLHRNTRSRVPPPDADHDWIDVPWEPSEVGLSYPSWRPGQRRVINRILNHPTANVIAVQAPTGFGKTGIGIAIGHLSGRTVIATATKILEDAYLRESPELTDIRGMQNYLCLAARDEHRRYFLTGRRRGSPIHYLQSITCDHGYCHVDVKCSLRDGGCTYFDAQRTALHSARPLTNYAYWLGTRIHGRGFGSADVVIADEAHALVEQITGALRISIPKSSILHRTPRNIPAWVEWAKARAAEEGAVDVEGDQTEVEIHHGRRTPASDRASQDRRRLAGIDQSWTWEEGERAFNFEPITPARYLGALWTPPTKLVLLSATMTKATLRTAGITPDLWIAQPSTFPVADRPVYVVKTCRVDYRMSNSDRQYWLDRHWAIISPRLDRKGVIHSGSYARQQEIAAFLDRCGVPIPVFCPSGRELSGALDEFKRFSRPAILISPAVTTGVDLPGTECEYQILSKVPFPDARSGIAAARFKRIKGYKDSLIMQTIVQAFGRGVRYLGDRCEGFIVDDHAYWFLKEKAEYAPDYFLDAVEFVRYLPRPAEKLAA